MNLNEILNSLAKEQIWNLEQFEKALSQEDKEKLTNFLNSKTLDKLEKKINTETIRNFRSFFLYNNTVISCKLVDLLKSGNSIILKQLLNLDTVEEFNNLKNLLDMGILDRLGNILDLDNKQNLEEIKIFLNLKDNNSLNKFNNIFKSNFLSYLKKLFLLGNPSVLDEQDIKENYKIKFFIKKEDEDYYYFSYYYKEQENGYIELSKNSNTPNFKKIAKVGDIIINYFNIDFFNILDNDFTSIDSLTLGNQMLELQNKVGILTSNLLIEYLKGIFFDLVSNPIFYYTYGNTLINKVGITQNSKKDFNYLLSAFTQPNSNYINMNSKACIQFITDIRDILKLGYTNLKNNTITNMFNLTNNNNTSQISYEILPNNETEDMLEVFTINDLITFLLFDIVQVNKYNIQIKVCQNCNKFFIPSSRSDEIYCNYPFNEKGISCRNLSYDTKVKSSDINNLCRKAYKSQNSKKNYYIKNYSVDKDYAKNKFDTWYTQIINKKIDCENGKISFEELDKYIKETSESLFFL